MKSTFFVPILILAIVAAISVTSASSDIKSENDTIVLTSENTLSLNAQVDGESVGGVIKGVKSLPKRPGVFSKKQPIYLFLYTPGGSIQAGLELIEALRGQERQVHTITLFAASMGFQIAQNLGDRLILKSGTLMSHRASGEMTGEFGGQSPSQMEKRYEFWKERITEMDQQTVDRSNGKQTMESYTAAYENELWLTGKKAVDAGYADRVVTVKCDETLDGVTTQSINFMGLNIFYDLDKCPINTAPTNIRMRLETTKGIMFSDEFVEKGGTFGAACLVIPGNDKLCTLDTSLNLSKIEDLKSKFVSHYNDSLNKVVYMKP